MSRAAVAAGQRTHLALVAVDGQIALDLDPERGVRQPDAIARRRPEHLRVCLAPHDVRLDLVRRRRRRLVDAAKALRLDLAHPPLPLGRRRRRLQRRRQPVPAGDPLMPRDGHERDGLGLARLKPHRRARRDVKPLEQREPTVERQLAVDLAHVVVRADLDRPIAVVGDLEPDPLAALVDRDRGQRGRDDDGARLVPALALGLAVDGREAVGRGDRQEAAVERKREVELIAIAADRVVDRHEERAVGEAGLNLHVVHRRRHRRHDMAAAENRLA